MSDDMPEGVRLDWLAGNCPVQAEGRFGEFAFYFRARYEQWSIDVASHPRFASALDDPEAWLYDEEWGDGAYSAGYMPDEVARQKIAEAFIRWRKEKGMPE